MTALKTRPPTGRVPWPLILVEGPEKAGKSWTLAELSASPKVGQTYWIDLGEGSADEYGAVPGARYLIVEHDGTFGQILAAVEAIKAEAARAAAADEPPVVIGIDSGTAEWDLLKGIADAKARQRLARKGKRLGPDEEPQISMDLWNEVNAKHRRLMTHLMTFPGIAVITARGKEVAALDNSGRPVEGSKEYKVEGQKGLAYDATVWIRVSRDHPPLVVGARSVHAGVRPGVDRPVPSPGLTLEKVVFDILRCNPAEAHVRDLVQPTTADEDLEPARPVSGPPAAEPRPAPTATGVRDWALVPDRTAEGIRNAAGKLLREHPAVAAERVTNEHGDEEQLSVLMERRAKELDPKPKAAEPAASVQPDRRRKRMFALLTDLGYGEPAQYRDVIGLVLKREVASSKDISAAEVEDVIAALQLRQRQLRQPAGAAA